MLRLNPWLAAMMLIGASFCGWLLAVWWWPWQVIVVFLGVVVIAFWRSVPKSHDGDGVEL